MAEFHPFHPKRAENPEYTGVPGSGAALVSQASAVSKVCSRENEKTWALASVAPK
jgi:hypothetical protein